MQKNQYITLFNFFILKFEDEVIDFILQYSPEAEIVEPASLPCKSVHIHDKNVVFHLLPVPFDGLQNLSPTFFQEKSLEYASRGIQLVHLWQDYWATKHEKVISRIAVLSGAFTRIHARRAFVRRLPKEVMFEFFGANHLQGFANTRYNYGLFYNEQLVAAASFSSGRKIIRNNKVYRSFELVRYSNLLNYRVAGGLGKLIARFINDVDPDDIMSYADLDWASGIGYQTLNFKQLEVSFPKAFWIDPTNMMRYYPHRLPHNIANQIQKDNLDVDDFLKDKGFVKVYNSGNLKYILECNKAK